MMAGLAGLVRACQYIWISDEVNKTLKVELPFDDAMNSCPYVDVLRCLNDEEAAQSGNGGSPIMLRISRGRLAR